MARVILSLVLFSLLVMPLRSAFGAEVIGPEAKMTNNEITVTTGLVLDEKNLNDLKNGISKEITFYVDLFRAWRMWPDEFIAGKKIVKTLWCDPIKKEYIATSFDGATLVEKRFKNFESMIIWTLNIKDLRLISTKELEQSDYFVKVTVESRLRKLPPVIGYLLFFVSEKDFRIVKDSHRLPAGGER